MRETARARNPEPRMKRVWVNAKAMVEKEMMPKRMPVIAR